MAVNSFLVTIYYNVIIAWCLFYFFASFRRKLPWSDCGNWWNTDSCSNAGSFCNVEDFEDYISYCLDASKNSTNFLCLDSRSSSNCTVPILPPEEYFE